MEEKPNLASRVDIGSTQSAPETPATPEAPAVVVSSEPHLQQQRPDSLASAEDIFKKVVVNNEKQNKRLSAKFNGASVNHKAAAAAAAASLSSGVGAAKKTLTNSVNSKVGSDDKGTTKMRFIVCTLGLISLAMSQMSRMVINQTITQMVDPSGQAKTTTDKIAGGFEMTDDGSCPWPPEELDAIKSVPNVIPVPSEELTTASNGLLETKTTSYTEDDQNMSELPDIDELLNEESNSNSNNSNNSNNSKNSNNKYNSVENLVSSTAAPLAIGNGTASTTTTSVSGDTYRYERFQWSMKQQSTIMGGFYYSYFVFMILGGRLAEVYGSKYVILLAVAGSALINLATPWMARTSFALLVASRVCMGAIQAGVFPAMYALIGKWLTMSEASIYAPLIKMNLRLGMVLGSLIPGIIPGWPNVFYFTGFLSVIWSIAWIIVASSDPADCKWVSEGELKHINKKKKHAKQQQQQQQQTKIKKRSLKTPWLKIWTAPSVIGLIIVKLTFNYALDFLAIELPTYLKYVHHASRQTISAITTPMFGIQVCLIVFVGWFAKVAVQKKPLNLSKTAIRKLFQSTASFGLALCFFLLTFNNCNLVFVAIMLQIISLLSMFTAGGETMLPYDLSEEYPATIMSIANSIANLSGITTTTLAGIVLGDQGGSYTRWNILIYLIVGANLFGGLAFILLVKAEPIDFDNSAKKRSENVAQREEELGEKRANNNSEDDDDDDDVEFNKRSSTTGRLEMVEIKLTKSSGKLDEEEA